MASSPDGTDAAVPRACVWPGRRSGTAKTAAKAAVTVATRLPPSRRRSVSG
jgi:hypothetical protein